MRSIVKPSSSSPALSGSRAGREGRLMAANLGWRSSVLGARVLLGESCAVTGGRRGPGGNRTLASSKGDSRKRRLGARLRRMYLVVFR